MKDLDVQQVETPRVLGAIAPREPMLSVGGALYDPPYETPLEDELAWHLVKYLRANARLDYQAKIVTAGGTFWVDFVLTIGQQRIGIECGLLDAEADTQAERFRDALVVGSGAVDVLYRMRGTDLFYRMEDLLYLLAQAHSDAFTPRACINLERLASPEAVAAEARPEADLLLVAYPTFEGSPVDAAPTDLRLKRLSQRQPAAWMHDHDQALAHYGVTGSLARSA